MTDHLPRVIIELGHSRYRSLIRWDKASLVLTVSLLSDESPVASTMSDRIDAHLGIRASNRRILIGDLDIMLDSEGHISSMEIRTNPARWRSERLPAATDAVRAGSIRLLDTFDENQIASHAVPLRIARDQSQQTVSFGFGDEKASQWAMLADHVIVGVTKEGRVSEFRLTGHEIPIG